MTYTLIKDWKEHKPGEQVELEDAVGNTLVEVGIAEETATKKTVQEEFQVGLGKFKDALTDTITNAVKDAADNVKKVSDGLRVGNVHDNELDDPMCGFKTGGEFLRSVRRAALGQGEFDERLFTAEKAAKAALGQHTADGEDGGYLLPPALVGGIGERQKLDETGILGRCQRIAVAGNSITMNFVKDADASSSAQRYGGVVVYKPAETGTITPSSFKFRQVNLRPKKYAALVYATDEMLADVAMGFAAWAEERIAFALNDELLEDVMFGDGVHGALGAFASDCRITTAKETGQAAATVVAQNIDKMYAQLPSWSLKTAAWFYNPEVYPQLRLLSAQKEVTGGFAPMFVPPGGYSAQPYGTILGLPAIPTEHCSALGTAGDIVLADFSQYVLAEKVGGIKAAMSIHVQFLTEQTAYRFTMRADGTPTWDDEKTMRKGTLKQSPFIEIIAR
jgi:HK97 family phage major capsid protein